MATAKICASVSAATARAGIQKIREAEKLADIIEIRFDHMNKEEVRPLLAHLGTDRPAKPLIATYRPRHQGGQAPDEISSRSLFWNDLGGGFWAADQEEDVFSRLDGVETVILSYHDFDGPNSPHENFSRLSAKRPAIVKYAYLAQDIADTIPAWKLLNTAAELSQPVVIIAMGEAGKITRILGPAYGSQWTYASVDEQTAPGQISIEELLETYRVRDISPATRIYGVIGDPVSHSLSPAIHNAAFKIAGLDSVFVPLLVKDLASFIHRMVRKLSREVDLNFSGFAVTMPHKLSIMEHLDEIDETARVIGAVNTVHIQDGLLKGYNTDAGGFIAPLLGRVGSLRETRVAIVGAGGAARACLYALKSQGAKASIVARDQRKGELLAGEFGAEALGINEAKLQEFEVVVNATPLGMADRTGSEFPFCFNASGNTKVVYDLVTSSAPTPLILAARAAGIETVTGVEMLVAQALRQFEIWTGKQAPADAMKGAVGL